MTPSAAGDALVVLRELIAAWDSNQFPGETITERELVAWTAARVLAAAPERPPAPAVDERLQRLLDGTDKPSPEMLALAARVVKSQKNDNRTDEQKIADGVKFIMGPGGDEGTRHAPPAAQVPREPTQEMYDALTGTMWVENNSRDVWRAMHDAFTKGTK